MLFGADGDNVTVHVETMQIKSDCDYVLGVLGDATFPRSMIGDDTITVHFPYDDPTRCTVTGTLTLNRVN